MLYQSTIANILLPSVNWFFYDKGVNGYVWVPPTPHTPLSCCVRLLPLLVCYSSRSYRGYHLHLTYPANTCSAFHQTHNEIHAQNLSHFYQWLGYIKNVARDTVTLVLCFNICNKVFLCFVTQCISQLFFYTDCLIIKKYLLLGENL